MNVYFMWQRRLYLLIYEYLSISQEFTGRFQYEETYRYLTRLPTQYWPLTFSPVWYSNVVATKAFPPILWNAWHDRLGFLQCDRYLGRMRTYHGPKAGRIFFLTNLNKRAPICPIQAVLSQMHWLWWMSPNKLCESM